MLKFLGFSKHSVAKLSIDQVSSARIITMVMMLSAIEVASFSFINMMLLTMSGIETNPGPCTYPTNGETLMWLENLQNEGKLSEERLKIQAKIFFSKEIKEDKKLIKKKLLGLIQERNNQLLQSQRTCFHSCIDLVVISFH